PTVVVVRGTGAFAGNHGGAQRMSRRAFLAEGPALRRLDHAAQHISGTAQLRLFGVDAGDVEPLLGIEIPIRRTQPPAASWNHANAAPRAVRDFEDLGQ